jgi:hypothetical protein
MAEAAQSIAERQGAILAELSELGLSLARDLQARALRAEDDSAARDLALAFHAVARTLRQTLALETRLAREHAADLRQHELDEDRRRPMRVLDRKSLIRNAVSPLIWNESEEEGDSDGLFDDLEEYLHQAACSPTFLEDPIEPYIAKIRTALGLPANDDADADAAEDPPLERAHRLPARPFHPCHPGKRAALVRDP